MGTLTRGEDVHCFVEPQTRDSECNENENDGPQQSPTGFEKVSSGRNGIKACGGRPVFLRMIHSASGCSWQHARPRGKVGRCSAKLQRAGDFETCFDLPLAVQLSPLFGVVSFRPTRGLPTRAGDGPDTGATQSTHLQIAGTFRRLNWLSTTRGLPTQDDEVATGSAICWPIRCGPGVHSKPFLSRGAPWCGCSSEEVGGPGAPSPGYGCRCASDCATWGQTRRVTEQLGQRFLPLFDSPGPHLTSA
jgi:hypothetical protein